MSGRRSSSIERRIPECSGGEGDANWFFSTRSEERGEDAGEGER